MHGASVAQLCKRFKRTRTSIQRILLDMRMEQAGLSAADVVNEFQRSDLTRIIGILGEERQASRISTTIYY